MAEKIGEFMVRIGVMKQYKVGDVLRVQAGGDTRFANYMEKNGK